MNMYSNFIIMAVALTASLMLSYKMLKLQADEEKSKLLELNGISLLIVNAVAWAAVMIFSPDAMFNQFNKSMIFIGAVASIIIPLLEMKYNAVQKLAMPIYTIIGWGIMAFAFDLRWELIVLFGIFWGTFVFIFDKFNTDAKIATNILPVILIGIAFLNVFLPTSLSIVFLAFITAVILIGFYVGTKNDVVNFKISKEALHGFVFLTGMFFMYLASLGYFMVAIIIPAYFIGEHISYYIILGIKKIFKKDTPTYLFFQTAINRGANYWALNKYIRMMTILLILLASVYAPQTFILFVLATIVVVVRIFIDFYKWGEKKLSFKESMKQTMAEAKEAGQEARNNIKTILNKFKK